MVKEDIETIIDRLYDYVNTNGRVSVDAAAKAIGLPTDQVEKLAVLLENSGLLEMQYTLTHVVLVSKSFVMQQAEAEGKKSKASKDVVAVEANALEQEVLTTENIVGFMERDLIRRIGKAEAMLKHLEGTRSFTPGQLDFLKREIETILKQLHVFDSEVHTLEAGETSFEDKVMRFRERITLLEQKKAAEPKSAFNQFTAQIGETFSTLKRAMPKISFKTQAQQEHEPHPSIPKLLPLFTLPKIQLPQFKQAPKAQIQQPQAPTPRLPQLKHKPKRLPPAIRKAIAKKAEKQRVKRTEEKPAHKAIVHKHKATPAHKIIVHEHKAKQIHMPAAHKPIVHKHVFIKHAHRRPAKKKARKQDEFGRMVRDVYSEELKHKKHGRRLRHEARGLVARSKRGKRVTHSAAVKLIEESRRKRGGKRR